MVLSSKREFILQIRKETSNLHKLYTLECVERMQQKFWSLSIMHVYSRVGSTMFTY